MGHLAFDVTFAGLWALVAVETVVLVHLLRRTVRLKAEVYAAMPNLMKMDRLAGGTFVEFEAPDVESGAVVRSAELRGSPAALLFIRAQNGAEGVPSDWLLDTIEGLRHKGEGRLFVLCDGSAAACAELLRGAGAEVPVLLDDGGRIADRFLVHKPPAGVLLDTDARITAYGMPD